MILTFPDKETLILCVASGTLPVDLVNCSANVGEGDDGRFWFETETTIPDGLLTEIKRLGVKKRKTFRGFSGVRREVPHWFEAVPCQAVHQISLPERANVIFDIPETESLSELVHEMLRQGNDRQSVRFIENGMQRTLLKVVGPPYFTLLRSVSSDGVSKENGHHSHGDSAATPTTKTEFLRAYVEAAPRVWIELGYQHPFAQQFEPAPGQSVFIDRYSKWQYLNEEPFRDLYQLVQFELPAGLASGTTGELTERIQVPLKLQRGTTADEQPELWELTGDGISRLEQFVRNSSDAVLQRLAFTVVNFGEQRSVLLRVRPSRLSPPVLPFDGIGTPYRNILRINNLFLPMGRRLHPPLRRDAVRSTLAPDDSLIYWLKPAGDEGFQPLSVAERAFQPLTNWVDYVLDQHQETLSAWVSSCQFDFSDFICDDGRPDPHVEEKKQKPKRESTSTRLQQHEQELAEEESEDQSHLFKRKPKAVKKRAPQKVVKDVDRELIEAELSAAQKEFLDLQQPLDSPERYDSWLHMAQLNDVLKRHTEAAVLRLHHLWDNTQAPAEHTREWLQSVIRTAGRQHSIVNEAGKISDERIQTLLKNPSPLPVEAQQLAAYVVCCEREGHLDKVRSRLGDIQNFLEQSEHLFPIRTAWLAWTALARIAGGDHLLLGRARDRILERLFHQGLPADLELPSFLRVGGSAVGDRFQQVRQRFIDLRKTVQAWSRRNLGLASPATGAYIDLIYAYALARLGESTIANKLLDSASKELTKSKDGVHEWLRLAYRHRIRQAVDGTPTNDPLPQEMTEYLEILAKLDRYKVDRLRQHSDILEPHEKMDPYHAWRRQSAGDLQQTLSGLFDVKETQTLKTQLMVLLRSKSDPDEQAQVLARALELSPRLGEEQATEWLAKVDATVQKASDPLVRATLLERSMAIAAHYGQTTETGRLFERLRDLLLHQKSANIKLLTAIEAMLSQSFRGLRRLGMRDELAQLLEDLSNLVKTSNQNEEDEPERLSLLLQLAGGWFYFGNDKGWETLDRVRDILFHEKYLAEGHVGSKKQTDLAMAYISAVGQTPLEDCMHRFEELFENLEGIHDSNTVNSHYSLKQLDIVETLIRTVVSDDFSVDKATLRWLDEEEFLIRRRIHQDMQHALQDC